MQNRGKDSGEVRGRRTNSEALDGFVLGSAAGAVGAADWFGVATAMLVATVVSAR
jgi:hypothetical protein